MRAQYGRTIQSIPARIPAARVSASWSAGRPGHEQAQRVLELWRGDWADVGECQLGGEFPAAAFAGCSLGQVGRVHGHAPFGCAHNDLRLAASRLSGRSGSAADARMRSASTVIYPVEVRNDGGLRKNVGANPERYVHRRIREFGRPFSASRRDLHFWFLDARSLRQNRENRVACGMS